MKRLLVLLFWAIGMFGAEVDQPLVLVFKIRGQWILDAIPSLGNVEDSVQVWVRTERPGVEAFKVTVSFEHGGKKQRLEAVVQRSYTGASAQTFPMPTVDVPITVSVQELVASSGEVREVRVR